MKLIHIVPVKNNMLVGYQSMYMFLTHLVLANKEYREAAIAYSGYKILDNSLIECNGVAMGLEQVLEAAEIIGANEIILPDVFLNGPATLALVEESWRKIVERGADQGKYKLMAVCQGKDAKEFAETFKALTELKYISVIGIPKVCAKLHPQGRPHFEHLWLNMPEDNGQEIHLLGIWYSFNELFEYKAPEYIRSVDSCLAAFIAKNNMLPYSVRPDGFTIDLENDIVQYSRWIEAMPESADREFFNTGGYFLCSHIQ